MYRVTVLSAGTESEDMIRRLKTDSRFSETCWVFVKEEDSTFKPNDVVPLLFVTMTEEGKLIFDETCFNSHAYWNEGRLALVMSGTMQQIWAISLLVTKNSAISDLFYFDSDGRMRRIPVRV